ncbi:MAG: hypothetical protein ACK4PC_00705 [Sphingopyxis sp.]
MTGGLQQYSRVLRAIDADLRGQDLQPPAIAPAEDLQADLDDAGADRAGLPAWAWLAFAATCAALALHHAAWSATL